jgi:capsular polysaccharide biosynthesis protein
MTDSFDVYGYLSHLARRWAVVAGTCVVALLVSLLASALMTRQYQAKVRILIQPPASTDSRGATAISPIYLESLKTYQHLAASDSLFEKAVEDLQLRDSPDVQPLASLKERALGVHIPRNTRIMEITVKLPDRAKALALARYLAAATVRISGEANRSANQARFDEFEALLQGAKPKGIPMEPEAHGQKDSSVHADLEFQEEATRQWASVALQGEQLLVVDEGVVPERPVSPKPVANGLIAICLGLGLALFYLTFDYSFRERRAESLRRGMRVAQRG